MMIMAVLISASYYLLQAVPELYSSQQDYRISQYESLFENGQDTAEISLAAFNKLNLSIELVLQNSEMAGNYQALSATNKGYIDQLSSLVTLQFYKFKKPSTIKESRSYLKDPSKLTAEEL